MNCLWASRNTTSTGKTASDEAGRVEVIATSLRTANERWLSEGRLIPALLASAAIPAVFAPVVVGSVRPQNAATSRVSGRAQLSPASRKVWFSFASAAAE